MHHNTAKGLNTTKSASFPGSIPPFLLSKLACCAQTFWSSFIAICQTSLLRILGSWFKTAWSSLAYVCRLAKMHLAEQDFPSGGWSFTVYTEKGMLTNLEFMYHARCVRCWSCLVLVHVLNPYFACAKGPSHCMLVQKSCCASLMISWRISAACVCSLQSSLYSLS